MVEKIILAKPRGFCAGVEYAVGIVEKSLTEFDLPIYILKEIVHNKKIVQDLSLRGAKSVSSIEEVPKGSILIFSAHGVPPEFHTLAKERGLYVIDATCPLVRKVHLEAIRFVKEGYTILYIGHAGHDEALGVIAEAPDSIILINDKTEALSVQPPDNNKLAFLTQTTLSLKETGEIINILQKRFPQIIGPDKEDICYATTNRQAAVSELAKLSDLVLVLGSENSSNSQRLRECAEEFKINAYLIDGKEQIENTWFEKEEIKTIGITAGASAPESLVKEVVNYFQEKYPKIEISELTTIKEKTYFPIPNLKQKLIVSK